MATLAAASVLAHQGGWDEILFVLAPLAIFAWLLVMARRRADRFAQDDPDADGGAAPGAVATTTTPEGDEGHRTP